MSQARDDKDAEVGTDASGKSMTMLRQRQDAAALDQVMADLDQVIKRSPKNVYAHYNKGNIYMLQGDYTSAISSYSMAIQLKPDLAEAYYNRGLMYLRMGNKALGVADLSKAGELGVLPSYNVLKRMTR
jgi:tetratricopeptide (TPR) repeat protein